MKNIMTQEDLKLVEDRLKMFEEKTGCELLLVVTNSSDPYPAAAWRFGFFAGLALSLIFSHYYEFQHAFLWPVSFFFLTAVMTWVGHFSWAKKLALSDWEVERESREKSIEYFHTLGTSKVTHKVTAMIMVSLLEKKIQVLIDEKLKSKIETKELNKLIEVMKGHFKQKNIGLGFIQSIGQLEEKILSQFGGKISQVTSSELADKVQFV